MEIVASNPRAQARLQQRQIDERRRALHGHVVRLLRDQQARPDVIAYADGQVKKWRKERLCSVSYIDAWSALLRDPERAADLLESDSPAAVSMRQNSPFAAYLR